MDVNYSSASGQVVEYGYTGTYTGGGITYPYELTSHGVAQPNSIMEGNQFATTGTVELRVVTDADSNIIVIDWQAMSDDQEWRVDIEDANSVTTVAEGSTTVTLGYRIVETGATGTFERTIEVTDGTPSLPVGLRKALKLLIKTNIKSGIKD